MVALAQSGDRAAFSELVRRRQGAVRGLMRRLSGDATLADDLAQDVFIRAWTRIRSLRDAGAFGAWLRRIAVTAWLRHRRRSDVLNQAADLDELELAGDSGGSTGLGMDLDRALAGLSEDQRLCVVLAYHEGMTHPEVAELTGLPLGTVKSHVVRGSKRLRQGLAAYRGEPAPGEVPEDHDD